MLKPYKTMSNWFLIGLFLMIFYRVFIRAEKKSINMHMKNINYKPIKEVQ